MLNSSEKTDNCKGSERTHHGATFLKEVQSFAGNTVRNRIILLTPIWAVHALEAIAETTVLVKVTRNNLATLFKQVLSYEILQVENFSCVNFIKYR
jgi:hypothetical protein